ncbi:hypothetical protein [Sulfitobacter sp.]
MIFLAGNGALKIKRAVRDDYMNLSTLEQRPTLIDCDQHAFPIDRLP